RQHEFRIADAERGIADQHLLVLRGPAALIFDLGAKAVDVGNRDLERLVVGIGPLPGALVLCGIDIGVFGGGRRQRLGRVGVGDDANEVGHAERLLRWIVAATTGQWWLMAG